MLNIKAVFRRKDTAIEATDCVVDKIVRLSGTEFDLFSRNLLRDWDFIRDSNIDTVVDAEGRYHCLLVVGEGRRDGLARAGHVQAAGHRRRHEDTDGRSALDTINILLAIQVYTNSCILGITHTGIIQAYRASNPAT